ncbi:hypothetical protein [Embleya sp. MST-111070]|uniref:hypothetical protein n=1 Tax=Embleya sp. MST-111070 TaxID=3398231 RepID=UPI003F734D0C
MVQRPDGAGNGVTSTYDRGDLEPREPEPAGRTPSALIPPDDLWWPAPAPAPHNPESATGDGLLPPDEDWWPAADAANREAAAATPAGARSAGGWTPPHRASVPLWWPKSALSHEAPPSAPSPEAAPVGNGLAASSPTAPPAEPEPGGTEVRFAKPSVGEPPAAEVATPEPPATIPTTSTAGTPTTSPASSAAGSDPADPPPYVSPYAGYEDLDEDPPPRQAALPPTSVDSDDPPPPYVSPYAGLDDDEPTYDIPSPTGANPVADQEPATGSDGAATAGYFPRAHDWEWAEEKSDRRKFKPMLLVAAGAAGLLVVVVGVVLLAGGEDKKPSAGPALPSTVKPAPSAAKGPAGPAHPSASASGWVTQTARPVDQAQLAARQARSVAVSGFDKTFKLSWEAPVDARNVSGYVAVAQTPAGSLIERVLVGADEHVAVFAQAPSTSCFVVTTLIGEADGVRVARGEPVCPAGNKPTTQPRS